MIQINSITVKTLRALLVFSVSCLQLNFAIAAEQKPQSIKSPVSGVSKVQNPAASLGGVKAETSDKAEQRLPATLQHKNRAANKKDYKKLDSKSPGATVGTPSLAPINQNQKQQLKQSSKTTNKKSSHNYPSLNSSGKAYTPTLGAKQKKQGQRAIVSNIRKTLEGLAIPA